MLREVALETLDDPDPEVTLDALIYLKNYGEASDEEPISHRYTQWSQKWQGRAQELDTHETGSLAGNWQEIGLGENLALALIANQGWLASEKLIQSTLEQCVGEQMCQKVNQLAATARAIPYSISAYKNREIENYEIAQYTSKSLELLDAKIAQFPKGSRFVITNDTADNDTANNEEQNRLNSRVKDLLAQHGMVIDRGPQNQPREGAPRRDTQ